LKITSQPSFWAYSAVADRAITASNRMILRMFGSFSLSTETLAAREWILPRGSSRQGGRIAAEPIVYRAGCGGQRGAGPPGVFCYSL
jgi:hypothetical protein